MAAPRSIRQNQNLASSIREVPPIQFGHGLWGFPIFGWKAPRPLQGDVRVMGLILVVLEVRVIWDSSSLKVGAVKVPENILVP